MLSLRFTQRQRNLLGGVLAFVALVAAACNGASSTKPPYTSAVMIQKASTNFNSDTALHFTLTADGLAPGLYAVRSATGDVVRPDKMKVTGKSEITKGVLADIGFIFIGQNQYIDIGNTGHFTPITGLPNLPAIFSPNQGIGAILNQFQNPSDPTADTVGGVSCWKITGTVDSTLLAPFTGSTATTGVPVKTTLWIGQGDYQIHQVTLTGKAADGDTDATVRTFMLSNFNEQVTITAPTSGS